MHANPSSLMQAMREASHDLHLRLEHRLTISSPDADKDDYVQYIRAMWGWLSPIEPRLWSGEWPVALNATQRSCKTAWLEEDLRHAGLDASAIANIPLCTVPPRLATMGERIGWAYVIEGAQLGGQVLRKRLALALDPWVPRWLAGYGSQTAANWKIFAAYVDSTDDPQLSRDAIRAAVAAFASLATWLQEQKACRADGCEHPL